MMNDILDSSGEGLFSVDKQVSKSSSFVRSGTPLHTIPPDGGIKRPHVGYDGIIDTCGFVPPHRNPQLAASLHAASPKSFLSNNASLNRYASLRYVSLIRW